MKKKALLPILALTPLLLANSPAPFRGPVEYEDYEVSSFSSSLDGGTYKNSFVLKNTGEGYLSLSWLDIQQDRTDLYSPAHPEDELLAKNGAKEITFTSSRALSQSALTFSVYGYKEFIVDDAATFTNYSAVEKETLQEDGKTHFRYSFTVEFSKNTEDFGNFYAPIFEVTSGGKTYYFHEDMLLTEYAIETATDLDVNDMSISCHKFIEAYEYYRNHGRETDYGAFAEAAIMMLLIFCIIAFVVPGGIFLIIFFSVRHARRKRREKQRNAENEEDHADDQLR